MKEIYFRRGAVAGFVGGAGFFPFFDFLPKKSIVSSYFVVEKRVFLWGYIRKRGYVFCGHNRKTKF